MTRHARAVLLTAVLLIALPVAGCTGVGSDGAGAAPASHPKPKPTPTTPPPPPPAVVQVKHYRTGAGALVTVARFTGGVRFVLHCGSQDPGPSCAGLSAGSAIGPVGRATLVAAFNGGFKLSTGAGGYEQEGRVISPLQPGLASLVIYQSGVASIGMWQRDVPAPGQQVYSVRQNLHLLVDGGRLSPSAAEWPLWGATLSGGEYVARSALGENASGQLIFVASMYASPVEIGRALIRAGATVGMELDINPEWVQLAYARTPGGKLHRGVAGQVRPASQYLVGWTRDFVAVLALNPASG